MDPVRNLLAEQRNRLVATVLTKVEPRVPKSQWRTCRQEIMDAIGIYHDLVLDVLKVTGDGTLRNEEALRLIQAVHESSRRIESALENSLNGRSA